MKSNPALRHPMLVSVKNEVIAPCPVVVLLGCPPWSSVGKEKPWNGEKAILQDRLLVIKTAKDKFSTSHLIFRLWSSRERNTLMVKPLHVVKFHNFVIIFSPPSLCLPFVEHLTAVIDHSMQKKVTA